MIKTVFTVRYEPLLTKKASKGSDMVASPC